MCYMSRIYQIYLQLFLQIFLNQVLPSLFSIKTDRVESMKIINFDFPKKLNKTSSQPILAIGKLENDIEKFGRKIIKIMNQDTHHKVQEIRNQLNQDSLTYLRRIVQFYIKRDIRMAQILHKKTQQINMNAECQREDYLKQKIIDKTLIINQLTEQLKQKNDLLQLAENKLLALNQKYQNWSYKTSKRQILKRVFQEKQNKTIDQHTKTFFMCRSIEDKNKQNQFFMTHQSPLVRQHNVRVASSNIHTSSRNKKGKFSAISFAGNIRFNKKILKRSQFVKQQQNKISTLSKQDSQAILKINNNSYYPSPQIDYDKNSIIDNGLKLSECNYSQPKQIYTDSEPSDSILQ